MIQFNKNCNSALLLKWIIVWGPMGCMMDRNIKTHKQACNQHLFTIINFTIKPVTSVNISKIKNRNQFNVFTETKQIQAHTRQINNSASYQTATVNIASLSVLFFSFHSKVKIKTVYIFFFSFNKRDIASLNL